MADMSFKSSATLFTLCFIMPRVRDGHRLGLFLPEARAAFDIGEEKCDGAGGELIHNLFCNHYHGLSFTMFCLFYPCRCGTLSRAENALAERIQFSDVLLK